MNSLTYANSNTSHVLIYLIPQNAQTLSNANSNTSHVLIYQCTALKDENEKLGFKYISCSYLSAKTLKSISCTLNSNTSHVLIYRGCSFRIDSPFSFKYISCSYLSHVLF